MVKVFPYFDRLRGDARFADLVHRVFLGDAHRFANGNKVASYIAMIPCEHSSGKRQRLGTMTKEGNSLLRYLWTEAVMHAVGKDPELKRSIAASSPERNGERGGTQTWHPAVEYVA